MNPKVILVGNSGVGKTSLISKFLHLKFEDGHHTTVAPICYDITLKTRNKTLIPVKIWDTSGIEKFCSLNKFILRNSNVALICFDPTSNKSVESIEYWFNAVKEYVPQCMIILVIMKNDLIEESEIFMNEVKLKAQSLGAQDAMLTSAKNGQGVQELFNYIGDTLLKISHINEMKIHLISSFTNEDELEYFQCCRIM